MRIDKKIYKIIDNGKNKGMRLYDETKHDASVIFFSEMSIAINNLIDQNINFYLLYNSPTHNIIWDEIDFKYLNQSKDQHYKNSQGIYPNNIKLIKDNQCNDFWKINNIGGLEIWIVIPHLDSNNKYYYDLLIGLSKDSNINDFFNLQLDLIKINSIDQLNNKIFYELFESLFNFDNYVFENAKFTKVECNLIDTHDQLKITTEYVEHIKLLDWRAEYRSTYKSAPPRWSDDKEEELRKKVLEKSRSLYNHKLAAEIAFRKLSYHIYVYSDEMLNNDDNVFFTNFNELAGGGKAIKTEDGKLKIIQEEYMICLLDIIIDSLDTFFCFNVIKNLK